MIDYAKKYTYREAFQTLGFEELLAHAIQHGTARASKEGDATFVTFVDPYKIKGAQKDE